MPVSQPMGNQDKYVLFGFYYKSSNTNLAVREDWAKGEYLGWLILKRCFSKTSAEIF